MVHINWRPALAAIGLAGLTLVAAPDLASAAPATPAGASSTAQVQAAPKVLQGTTRILFGIFPNRLAWCATNPAPHRNGSAVLQVKCRPGLARPANQTWHWVIAPAGHGRLNLQAALVGPGIGVGKCLVNSRGRADIGSCRAPPLRAKWQGDCYYQLLSGGKYLTATGRGKPLAFRALNPRAPETQLFYFRHTGC